MTSTVQTYPFASLAETLSVVDAALASVARSLPAHVSREDLASAGKVALVQTLLRFEGSPEEARAYCYARVRGALFDELRRLDPLSRHARDQVRLVRQTFATLERDFGRAPTAREVASAAGLSVTEISRIENLAATAVPDSLDETDAEGLPRHDLVDADAACPAKAAESDDVNASVQAALGRLPAAHAHVLRRYYLDEATLDEIAAEMGLSKERIRQVREAAEKKLRADFIVLALWQSFLVRDRKD